jgi:hypothetical protein
MSSLSSLFSTLGPALASYGGKGGGGLSSGMSSANVGGLLSSVAGGGKGSVGGGKGGEGLAGLLTTIGGQGGGGNQDFLNLIAQNPELFNQVVEQGNKIFQQGTKGAQEGVKFLANRLITDKNLQNQIELKKYENERLKLELQAQKIKQMQEQQKEQKLEQQREKGRKNCERCFQLKDKKKMLKNKDPNNNLSEEEQEEMERVCRACEEICYLLDTIPELKDLSLQAFCQTYSRYLKQGL